MNILKLLLVFIVPICSVYLNVVSCRIKSHVGNSTQTIEKIAANVTIEPLESIDLNTTVARKMLPQHNGLDIEKKLHYANILRENVATALGQLIYTHSTVVTNDQLHALRKLQDVIVERQFSTTNLLPLIKTINMDSTKNQLIDLFTILSKVIGEEEKCNALLNLKALTKGDWDPLLNKLHINLLQNITIDDAKKFASTITGHTDTFDAISQKIIDSLANGEIMSTSDLIAELMMSLPIINITPEMAYAEHIIYKFLSEFHETAKPLRKMANIQSMLKYILNALSQVPEIGKTVRDSLGILLSSLNNATILLEQEEIDPEILDMRKILENNTINMAQLLREFDSEDYPSDILEGRDILVSSFNNGLLLPSKIFDNSDQYKYQNKIQLLLAVLNKLQKSDLFPNNLSGLFKSLYVHAKLKLVSANKKPVHLRGDSDVEELLNAYENLKNENIYDELLKTMIKLRYELLNHNVDWSELSDFTYSQCTDARNCTRELLHKLSLKDVKEMKIIQNVYNLIRTYMRLVDENGQPLQLPPEIHRPFLNEFSFTTSETNWNALLANHTSNFENLKQSKTNHFSDSYSDVPAETSNSFSSFPKYISHSDNLNNHNPQFSIFPELDSQNNFAASVSSLTEKSHSDPEKHQAQIYFKQNFGSTSTPKPTDYFGTNSKISSEQFSIPSSQQSDQLLQPKTSSEKIDSHLYSPLNDLPTSYRFGDPISSDNRPQLATQTDKLPINNPVYNTYSSNFRPISFASKPNEYASKKPEQYSSFNPNIYQPPNNLPIANAGETLLKLDKLTKNTQFISPSATVYTQTGVNADGTRYILDKLSTNQQFSPSSANTYAQTNVGDTIHQLNNLPTNPQFSLSSAYPYAQTGIRVSETMQQPNNFPTNQQFTPSNANPYAQTGIRVSETIHPLNNLPTNQQFSPSSANPYAQTNIRVSETIHQPNNLPTNQQFSPSSANAYAQTNVGDTIHQLNNFPTNQQFSPSSANPYAQTNIRVSETIHQPNNLPTNQQFSPPSSNGYAQTGPNADDLRHMLDRLPTNQQFKSSPKLTTYPNSQPSLLGIGQYYDRNANQMPMYQGSQSTPAGLNNPIPSRYVDKFNNFPIIPQSKYNSPNTPQMNPQFPFI